WSDSRLSRLPATRDGELSRLVLLIDADRIYIQALGAAGDPMDRTAWTDAHNHGFSDAARIGSDRIVDGNSSSASRRLCFNTGVLDVLLFLRTDYRSPRPNCRSCVAFLRNDDIPIATDSNREGTRRKGCT